MVVCGGTYKVQARRDQVAGPDRPPRRHHRRPGPEPISEAAGAAAWSFSAPGTSRSPGSPWWTPASTPFCGAQPPGPGLAQPAEAQRGCGRGLQRHVRLAGDPQPRGAQQGRRLPDRRRPRPTHFDGVTWNEATRNPGGCGVIVAGHSTAGVTGTVVAHNLLTFNGSIRRSRRRGGHRDRGQRRAVSNNNIADNEIYGNGLAGVTIHSHVQGQRMSGNQIVDNDIGKNNIVGDTMGSARRSRTTRTCARPEYWSVPRQRSGCGSWQLHPQQLVRDLPERPDPRTSSRVASTGWHKTSRWRSRRTDSAAVLLRLAGEGSQPCSGGFAGRSLVRVAVCWPVVRFCCRRLGQAGSSGRSG